MPCIKCGNKYKIGEKGPCRFTSKEACQRAYKAYLAKANKKLGCKDKEDKEEED